MQNLIYKEFDNSEAFHSAQQELSTKRSIKILDHCDKRLFLLAEVQPEDNFSFQPELTIESPHSELLLSYFKLLQTKVSKNLCVIESPSMAKLLEVCNNLLTNFSYRGIEIYRKTDEVLQHRALLCNGQEKLPNTDSAIKMTLIKEINDHVLQEFF